MVSRTFAMFLVARRASHSRQSSEQWLKRISKGDRDGRSNDVNSRSKSEAEISEIDGPDEIQIESTPDQ